MRSLHAVFKTLAGQEISVDMITKNVTHKGTTALAFTVRDSDHDKAVNISKELIKKVKRENVISTRNLAKISLVGIGMKSHCGVAAKLFEELSKHDIQIKMITTSDIKLSILIDEVHAEEAVKSLHDAFELDKGGIKK
jgi:aspartate kinase